MRYRLTESAKTKYHYAFMISSVVGLFAIFIYQGVTNA